MKADDLLVLLEIGRRGSLSSAAAALALNHATLSRRLTALEREVGQTLVARTPQGCELTPAGASLMDSCESVERAVAATKALSTRAADRDALYGTVQINGTDAFGTAVLTPILAEVCQSNPDLRIELITSIRMNPYAVGMDIDVGLGEPLASRRGVRHLAFYDLAWYASPAYLERHGTPRSNHELAEHDLVFYVEAARLMEELLLIGPSLAENVRFGSTNIYAQVNATRAGAGIGLLPAFLARSYPELQRVLPEVAIRREFLYAMASVRTRRPATEAVMEALIREVANYADTLCLPDGSQ